MPLYTYTYSVANDFPNQVVSLNGLTIEIQQNIGITTALDNITTAGDDCDIVFRDLLSGAEEIVLDGIVAAHQGVEPTTTTVTSALTGSAVTGNPIIIAGVDASDIVRAITTTDTGVLIVTGTVSTTGGGSTIVTSLPNITGSVNVTNTSPWSVNVQTMPAITGAVHVTNSVLQITGTVATIGGGSSVIVTSMPDITGAVNVTNTSPWSVNVQTQPNITGAVHVTNSTIEVSGTFGALDSANRRMVVGAYSAGTAASVNPVVIGGINVATIRAISADSSGRLIVTGPSAAGAAPTGNPVLFGGSDGSDVRYISTDTAGRLIVTGTVASSTDITSIPNVTGAVHITNSVLQVTGTVATVGGGGSVIVTSMPNITGAVHVTNTVLTVTGTVATVGGGGTITGSVHVTNSVLAVTGSVTSTPRLSSTTTLSSVSAVTSSATILNANSLRVGFTLYNDATSPLYLKLNSGSATTSSFTVKMQPDGYYEGPFSYTGAITGIWTVQGGGSARITEFT